MALRTVSINDEALADVQELRKRLEEIVPLMNSLTAAGIQLKFNFGLDKDGKQALTTFEVLAPFNINQ